MTSFGATSSWRTGNCRAGAADADADKATAIRLATTQRMNSPRALGGPAQAHQGGRAKSRRKPRLIGSEWGFLVGAGAGRRGKCHAEPYSLARLDLRGRLR